MRNSFTHPVVKGFPEKDNDMSLGVVYNIQRENGTMAHEGLMR